MSSEREAAESRLLTGSTPSSSEAESTVSMGDVLTKEQHKDDDEEAPLPSPPTAGDAADQAQPEPPPPLPSLDDITESPCQRILEAQRVLQEDEPEKEQEKNEVKEDRLSEEVVLNGEDAIKNGEANVNLENMERCQGVTTTVDYDDGDLCNCEDCKWKKKDLSAEDLQEMMKLRRLGMDLRQYIRYTFNWFMESSGFSANSIKTPLPYPRNPPPLDSESLESFTELRDSVALLCERVPYHLFMWLVGQAQEFVIGVKVQLLTLLYDRSIENLAEVFLTKLLDGYEALLATAEHISDLLEPLQKELFSKVNLTWSYINKSLYQNYVYSDPLIQNNLPPFIGQLRKHLPLKGSEYHYLVHHYLAFDDEITKIGTLCPEIERLIDKYNAEQVTGSVTGSVMKKLREDFDQKLKLGQPMPSIDLGSKIVLAKEIDDSNSSIVQTEEIPEPNLETDSRFHVCSIPNAVEIQSMFSDWKKSPQQRLADLVEALTLSSPVEEVEKTIEMNAIIEKQCYSSCLDKTVKEGINKSVSWERLACKCHPNNFNVDSTLNVMEEKSQKSQNNKEVNHCTLKPDNLKVTPTSEDNEPDEIHSVEQFTSKHNADSCKEPMKKIPKTGIAQTTQTQTRHSTTQTTSAAHSHHQSQLHRHHHPGRCSSHSHLHGSLSNAVIKSSGPHRTHVGHNNHQSAAVTCHKPQHVVEHIKRLSASDLSPGENGDCSDSGSSHEDCSATNSPTPRDSSRHCDCCYCEVFGHGVPSVAPVSRNYNEMRERLRQILSKKKAKVCKAACNPHAKNSVEVSSSSSSLSSSSSTSSTITNIDSTTLPHPASRSNTPVIKTLKTTPVVASKVINTSNTAVLTIPPSKPKEDLWNIEAAVEFIEGNQSGKKDSKKAEKKARQKQKKLEEKQKKEKVEEDKQKLIELQKKTPEVTITVVNPQKKNCSQKAPSQQKLPEVSILPTSAPPSTFTLKKSTNAASKKKNGETPSNNGKNVNNKGKNTSSTLASLPASENTKKKTASVENDNSFNTTKSKSAGKAIEPVSPKTAVNESPSLLSNLTKKEKKKLRREMEKQEALKKELESKQSTTTTPASQDNQLQIVTIKRIMESNNAEPTVTITLKGQTPAEDRVLFTLVNGQTKDSDGEKQPTTTGKKKKNKGNNSANNQQQGQNTHIKSQSQNNNLSNTKSEQSQKQDSKNTKQLQQQQSAKDKLKNGKQQEEQKARQQVNVNAETKSTKSKKDKKNSDNKENIKQATYENPPKQGTSAANKKANKGNKVTASEFIQSTTQKQQQPYQQQHHQQQQSNVNTKNAKTNKSQNQNQNQSQNQKKNNSQSNSGKAGKTTSYANNVNQNSISNKADNQKVSKAAQNTSKQKQNTETVQNQKREQLDSFNNHHRETAHNIPCSINIENLKLPPGITITKVNAPAKPLPLKSPTPPKPANNTPKQTTIIAAPLSGVQSSNYGPPQGTGNVIVVDTGRLKQDLIPKNVEKDASKDMSNQSSSKKKKKKKNKNGAGGNNNDKSSSNLQLSQGNKQQLSQQHSGDYMNVEPARILHNPSTNMVTIRNPAFGPPPPKMEPSTQQAAIIKVAENGMVTIRSPALQQAINAGLQPPPKPEFIVKGTPAQSERPSHNNYITSNNDLTATARGSNGMPLSADIIELRRRLAQPSLHEQAPSSSTLFNNGLSSIQISKVTNGQSPNIPENGINLKGTSVTLTKIRNANQQQHYQPQHQQFEEPRINGNANAKSRNKKKKRGNGVRSSGDDLTFLESVFTPKDIDLEDGEMDDAERELEAFKRFCLQSVPPPRKEKVNLNIKDIVLKKKSSSSTSSTSTTASAAATAAAVVAAI